MLFRSARRRAKSSRDALVTGLSEGPIKTTSPAQGLHLVAQAPRRLSEARAVQLAHEAGLGVRPLSTMYLTRKPKPGLLIGFSAFSPDDFYRVSRAFSRLAAREQGRR